MTSFLYLVDVTVRPAADALNQLEVLLRIPAGDVRTAAHLPTGRLRPTTEPDRPGSSQTNTHRNDCQHNFNMAPSASTAHAHCNTKRPTGIEMPSGAPGEIVI